MKRQPVALLRHICRVVHKKTVALRIYIKLIDQAERALLLFGILFVSSVLILGVEHTRTHSNKSNPKDHSDSALLDTSEYTIPHINSIRTELRETPVIILIERKFNGLGAQFLRLIDALAFAESQGAELRLFREKYWNYGCGPFKAWNCYFEETLQATDGQVIGSFPRGCLELGETTTIPESRCLIISTPSSTRIASSELWRQSDTFALEKSRRLASRIWQLNRGTKSRVNKLLQDCGIRQNESFAGLHIRRGDKRKEVALTSVQRYIDAVHAMTPRNMPIFVSSDDGSILDQVVASTSRRVLWLENASKRRGHSQVEVNQRSLNSNREFVEELLAEIEALAKAKWFIGTFSSNMGRLVHILRAGLPETSLSLDDRWAPGVAYHTFGSPYCQWKSSNRKFCSVMRETGNTSHTLE